MRKLILKMDMSLDGFVESADGNSDWIFEHNDEGAANWVIEAVWQAGYHVMGRKTFEVMASYWPSSTEPYAPPMNAIPKMAFTRSQEGVEAIRQAAKKAQSAPSPHSMSKAASPDEIHVNAQSWLDPVISTDLVGEIQRQKQQPGKNLIAYGGVTFARELVRHDLVDEYRFVVRPVALGQGRGIFEGLKKPQALKLMTSCTFPSGSMGKIFARER